MQCRDRHKSFVFNIRDACFIMKMKNVKKIDMNKKLYEQIKALLADKLDEKEQKELFHHREFEERMHLQWNMDRQKELDDEVGRMSGLPTTEKACLYTILAICGCRSSCFATWSNLDVFLRK